VFFFFFLQVKVFVLP